MSEKKYTLLMQLGPKQGERVPIEGDEFILGRDPESNWAIEDIEVSRRHARMIRDKESYSIEDLGSTNGTFVNGQRIRTLLPLLPGATIRLGENVLLFYDLVSEEEDADTKAQAVEKAFVESDERPEKRDDPEDKEDAAKAEQPASQDAIEESPAKDEAVDPIKPKREARSRPSLDLSGSVSFLGNQIGLGILAIVVIGALALIAFLWYVDANLLWCDVFGNLIPACR